ncbi:hypothetical protein ANCDUO_01949 [Ancylostoma duodenale]|uniref:NR LBD domain-containing protein n=1 Tax=Ancylostoma duodenale TaxID=51022 RepID=A0A0C2H814_9BILA|nr:hypothetical protein ANCDUO_01949 [Ancylostoma duodenale]
MKKEWIMSDEARLEKKQRVEENRERRLADAMARADAIEDEDTQNDADVAERMRQRTSSQIQELQAQHDTSQAEVKPEELSSSVVRPQDDPHKSPPFQPPILAPAPGSSLLLTPALNPIANPMANPIANPITPMSDMVTIPREVLVKLIENNPPRVNCTCQCTCGRYPPGCAIVDEDERPSGRRDSFYMNSGAVDTRISAVSASANLNALTPSDHVTVNDVLAANLIYKSYDASVDPSRHEEFNPYLVNFAEGSIRRFVRMLKRLPCFSLFCVQDQCILIRREPSVSYFYIHHLYQKTSYLGSCIPYMVIHGAIFYIPNDTRLIGQSLDPRLSEVLPHCIRYEGAISIVLYYSSFKDELRSNENIMLILGLLAVFDAESVGIQDKDGVSRQFSFYSSLLQRYVPVLECCSKTSPTSPIFRRK